MVVKWSMKPIIFTTWPFTERPAGQAVGHRLVSGRSAKTKFLRLRTQSQ